MSLKLTDWSRSDFRSTFPVAYEQDRSFHFPHWYKFIEKDRNFHSQAFVSVVPSFSTSDIDCQFPVWGAHWRSDRLARLYYQNPCQENDPEKIKEAVDRLLARAGNLLVFM